MFGIFKSRNKREAQQLEYLVTTVAYEYKYITDTVEKGSEKLLISRAMNFYNNGGEEHAGRSPFEVYFNAVTGAIFDATEKGALIPQESARVWAMTDQFLDEHPTYRTPLVTELMNHWYEMLMRLGIV